MPPEVKAFRDKYTERRAYPRAEERISLIRTLAQAFERTYIFIDALVTLLCV
jgi:hypothetical protein